MKILFLDIDGVLNTDKQRNMFGRDFIDPKKVTMLDLLCQETGTGIVISSDWRESKNEGFEGTVQWLREAGLTVSIIDMTPIIPKSNAEWTRITLDDHRRDEIKAWLDSHPGVEKFAIIDDLQIRGEGIGGHAVQTSGFHGLEAKHLRLLRRLLT